ncbi:MAG: histidine kinase dimerization/phospho-acceptor domain-containing protein [Novosphingobium sp.]
MQIDDRLQTVLRTRAGGETSARTQFRQLVDLLGTLPSDARGDVIDSAWVKLAELSRHIPATDRAAAVAAAGLRLRSPRLVAELARAEPQIADAALTAAQLDEDEWLDLIPALPAQVRPLLRQRDDLGMRVEGLLDRLGIARHGLPPAGRASRHPANDTQPSGKSDKADQQDVGGQDPNQHEGQKDGGIGAIVRRIEAYRARHTVRDTAPMEAVPSQPLAAVAFTCDESGRVDWADAAAAPAVIGLALFSRDRSAAATGSPALAARFARRVPICGEPLHIEGGVAIAGDWRVDALARFDQRGRFTGYEGRLRRPCPPEMAPESAEGSEADRLRQLIHELRTPINAIQGFAEVIQQQLFGPTPHEYRAHAAAIAGDAARMLAGFDDLERLAKLATGAIELEPGACDLGEVVQSLADHLAPHMAARLSGFDAETAAPALPLGMAREEAERLVWRLLATLASSAAPSERMAMALSAVDGTAILTLALPRALADQADIFHAAAPHASTPLSAGMFGAGFALRLAANEAKSGGGKLERQGDILRLELPLSTSDLTAPANTESKGLPG